MSEILNQIPVPSGWTSAPIWSHFRRTKRTGFQDEELLSVYRDYGVIPRASRDDNFNKASDDLSGYQLVEPGDLVVNKMKAWQGSLGVSEYRGIVSPAYFVYALQSDLDVRFTHYLLRSQPYASWYRAISKGIRPNQWDLIPEDFGRVPVLAPPLPEQLAIADFLDRETAQIDAMIDAQERLVALLNERRKALVKRFVTRGVGQATPLVPSGVAHLGDVPDHWVVGPIKRFFKSLDSRRIPLSVEERSTRKGPYPYYGASGIIDSVDGYLFTEPLTLVSEDGANLLSRNHPVAFTARGRYWVNNHAHILKPRDAAVDYWSARLEAEDFSTVVTGSAQPKLTIEALMNFQIAAPPTEAECLLIQAELAASTGPMDLMITKARESIALMKERRSALISAAVTGRIDVRTGIEQVERDLEEARV